MGQTWRHILSISAARIYSLLISTIILLITARSLGPSSHGVLVACVAWVMLFANFASLSVEQVAHYRIQLCKGPDPLPKICGTVLFLGALSSIVAVGSGFLLETVFPNTLFRNIPEYALSMAFSLLPLIVFEQCVSSLLSAADRMKWYNWAQYAGRTLWLSLTATFLFCLDFNVQLALTAQICGQLLLVLVSTAGLVHGFFGKLSIDLAEAKELLKGTIRLHLNSVGAFILGQSGLLFLNHFSTPSEVAWYQVANQMAVSFLVIPYAASTVLYSKIARSSPDLVWPEQKKIMIGVLVMIFIFAAMAFLAAPWAIPLLLGDQYSPTVIVFRWLLLTVFGLSFAQLMAPQWISRGKFVWTTSATITAAIFNVFANMVFIPRFHLNGAVWVSLITYAGITVAFQFSFALWCERQAASGRSSVTRMSNKMGCR